MYDFYSDTKSIPTKAMLESIISTPLSATSTGCDLMDHVKTQIIPAFGIAIISILLWTISAIAVA